MKGAVLGGAGLGAAGALGSGGAVAAADDSATPATKVPRKKLGTTGVEIPILFMGGSQKFDMKYDKLLHRAYALGIDYIDTAQIYAAGQSQKSIAVFLEQVGRENIWITTKSKLMGSKNVPEGYKEQLDNCLEDLKTDYVEMYFMHMITDEKNLDPEFIKMGADLKKAGKCKYFGFSCHDGNVVELLNKAAKVGSAGIDAIMFRYNFRQYGDLELNKAIDACKAAGIGLLAMKTQSSVPDDLEAVQEWQSKDFTLGQAKLKSVWADERIDGCVSQMDNVQLLMENAKAAMSPVQLSMNDFHQLNKMARNTAPYACMGCNHICESTVQGDLKIADSLRYLMYDECYGDHETAQMLYRNLTPEQRDFEGIELAEATAACPQGIQIAERLQKAKARLNA
jgi:hypothetical protein